MQKGDLIPEQWENVDFTTFIKKVERENVDFTSFDKFVKREIEQLGEEIDAIIFEESDLIPEHIKISI